MNILLSAGPTTEPIDDVRCLTNFSSGKTGYAIARAASAAGHNVRLVSGRTCLEPPEGVEFTSILTTLELHKAIEENFEWADCLIMAAAVSDYRPREVFEGKRKKTDEGMLLELVPNPDILSEFGAKKGDKTVVGFALEVENGIESARDKCKRKKCDMIALNSAASLHGEDTAITLVYRDGNVRPLPATTKDETARLLVAAIDELTQTDNSAEVSR